MKTFPNTLKLLLVFVITFATCFCACSNQNQVVVQDFEMSDMQGYVDVYPWAENIGPITSGEEAVEKAKEIWVREFCSLYNRGNTWEEAGGHPIDVYYDNSSDCWYLTEVLPADMVGAVAHLIVRSDGEVLALWHEGFC